MRCGCRRHGWLFRGGAPSPFVSMAITLRIRYIHYTLRRLSLRRTGWRWQFLTPVDSTEPFLIAGCDEMRVLATRLAVSGRSAIAICLHGYHPQNQVHPLHIAKSQPPKRRSGDGNFSRPSILWNRSSSQAAMRCGCRRHGWLFRGGTPSPFVSMAITPRIKYIHCTLRSLSLRRGGVAMAISHARRSCGTVPHRKLR
jgi:hypothetical protein